MFHRCDARVLFAPVLLFSATVQAQSAQTRPPKPTAAPGEIQQPKGEWQKPGEIQQPKGTWQKPGEIQRPRDIQTVKEQCTLRLRVGSDALFDFDKATLTGASETTLDELRPMIVKAGPHPAMIEGHTDSVGTDKYNQVLSEKRAGEVRIWLSDHAVLRTDTPIKGYGKSKPVAPNRKPDGSDNPEGRALNRRVEVVINTCK